MLVAFGENGIKTLEDLADCATDDLIGWTERKKEKDAEPVRHKGVLEGFEVGRKEAEDMIMAARIAAGWVTPEDLEKMQRRAGGSGGSGRGCEGSRGRSGRGQGLTVMARERTERDGRKGDGRAIGDEERTDGPLRLCAVSRAHEPPDDLIRFVAGPDGTIVPDLARRLPGGASGSTADSAKRWRRPSSRKVFASSLKRQVDGAAGPAGAGRAVACQAAARDALSLANKAGLAVAGFAKVEEPARQGRGRRASACARCRRGRCGQTRPQIQGRSWAMNGSPDSHRCRIDQRTN